MIEDHENPYVKTFYRPTHYLLSEDDLDRIDGLVSSLNLAITEIIGRRAVVHEPFPDTPAQDDFNEQCYSAINEPPLGRPPRHGF